MSHHSNTPACRAGALTNCANRPDFEGLETAEWNDATVVWKLPILSYHSQEELSSSQERDANRSMELFYGRHISGTIPKFSSSSTELGQDIHDWLETEDDSLSWLVRAPKETLTPTGQVGKKALEWAEKEGIPEGSRLVSDSHFFKVCRIVAALKANPAYCRNGSALNIPPVLNKSGFDSRVRHDLYDRELTARLPIQMKPGDALVSTISKTRMRRGQHFSPIQALAILTCLWLDHLRHQLPFCLRALFGQQ